MHHALLVDDDPHLLRVLRLQLEQEGWVVENAGDAATAFRLLTEITPAVIVLDVMMPALDGIDLCQQLRHAPATEKVPIVLLTAYTTDANRERAVRAGATAVVAKPYDIDELRTLLTGLATAATAAR